MDRTHEQQMAWMDIEADLNTWYDQNPHASEQIRFQQSNPQFLQWIESLLIPSLLEGESAYTICLDNIVQEQDETLKFTKFLAAYASWEPLQAPANDVARDLVEQGYTPSLLKDFLLRRMTTQIENNVSYH